MYKKTLQGLLKELPKKSYVKIGCSNGFFYCDVVGDREKLSAKISDISSQMLNHYKTRLKNKKYRLENIDKIYQEKEKSWRKKHKDLEKLKEYRIKANTKKQNEKTKLPKAIMSLTTKIQEWTPLLKRVVVETYKGISPDEPNTLIIHIRGDEKGKYWTIKEYQDRNKEIKRGIHDSPYAVR